MSLTIRRLANPPIYCICDVIGRRDSLAAFSCEEFDAVAQLPSNVMRESFSRSREKAFCALHGGTSQADDQGERNQQLNLHTKIARRVKALIYRIVSSSVTSVN